MIKARHHKGYNAFFRVYVKTMLRFHFRDIHIHGDFHDEGRPVLLLGNHFSWWDGFFVFYLNDKVFKKTPYVMMLEEQLARRKFLSRIGAFSIKRGSRTSLESLQYAANLLNDKSSLLLIFPQGKISSLYRYPLAFEKGWSRITGMIEKRPQIVFMANLIGYFSHPRPCLNMYIQTFQGGGRDLHTDFLEGQYNRFLKASMQQQHP